MWFVPYFLCYISWSRSVFSSTLTLEEYKICKVNDQDVPFTGFRIERDLLTKEYHAPLYHLSGLIMCNKGDIEYQRFNKLPINKKEFLWDKVYCMKRSWGKQANDETGFNKDLNKPKMNVKYNVKNNDPGQRELFIKKQRLRPEDSAKPIGRPSLSKRLVDYKDLLKAKKLQRQKDQLAAKFKTIKNTSRTPKPSKKIITINDLTPTTVDKKIDFGQISKKTQTVENTHEFIKVNGKDEPLLQNPKVKEFDKQLKAQVKDCDDDLKQEPEYDDPDKENREEETEEESELEEEIEEEEGEEVEEEKKEEEKKEEHEEENDEEKDHTNQDNFVCYKFSRRKHLTQRKTIILDSNQWVGGVFQCQLSEEQRHQIQAKQLSKFLQPFQYDCPQNTSEPIAPLFTEDVRDQWEQDEDKFQLKRIPFLFTPENFDSKNKHDPFENWSDYLKVNEDYDYSETDKLILHKTTEATIEFYKYIEESEIEYLPWNQKIGNKSTTELNSLLQYTPLGQRVLSSFEYIPSYRAVRYLKHLQELWDQAAMVLEKDF